MGDNHFKKLYADYDDACRKIHRAEQRLDLLSEAAEIELRKIRLNLKESLMQYLE
jgi:uncharacterized protein YdcH (DUF465 family)